MHRKKGQSILEYVIVLTVIVAAVLAGVLLFTNQNKTSGLGKLFDKAGGTIEKAGTKITGLKAE